MITRRLYQNNKKMDLDEGEEENSGDKKKNKFDRKRIPSPRAEPALNRL